MRMTLPSSISGLQRLSVVVVLMGVAVRPPALGLVIKHEPQLDTELYVAPATYTRKDGKALPSTIIISRPIGVRDEPEKDPLRDFPPDALSFVGAADDSREGSIDLKHNIKFYKIECTSGRSCSSIIPAYTTTPPPLNLKPLSDEELKEYLEQFSLRNGFQYSDDFESSGSPSVPEESDFDGASEERAFGGHSDRGYWPGSRFRPGSQPSRGQVFKYQSVSGSRDHETQDPFRSPAVTWDQISSDFPSRPTNSWDRLSNKRPSNAQSYGPFPTQKTRRPSEKNPRPQMLKPLAPHDDAILPPYGPPRPPPRPTKRPASYDGVWNRYGMSTVSQLDRDTGRWVKISSSNTHLDQKPYSEPPRPSDPQRAPTHHASASLTVLGVNDRQPHSFPSHERNSSHTVEVPSALPGNPPETIETGGGYAQSFASVPLSVIAPGLFRPLTPAPASSIESTGVAHAPAGFFDNPSAVMAAVGAGLIPATFAALLPVFVGGRRRRRRRSVVPDGLDPSRRGSPEKQVAEVSPGVWRALDAHQDNAR
ncbi:hypothetical protein C7M84_010662 [Penaeus vannamei]|uniref:Uncharacterized protein n=1 Tax=Penaeus vannamei TaxID=6689 RepID=A0A3R7SQR5_PENVA|nr:hypothetical protein C7M84_010662 [Penaeus vannamei]